MSNKSIYVISTISKSKENEYKIGNHSGTQKKLQSRYQTYLVNPIIFYYRPVTNWQLIDSKIKSELKKFRLKNDDNKLTEWFKTKLNDIISCINDIIDECDSTNHDDKQLEDINSDDTENSNDNNKLKIYTYEDFMKCSTISAIVITNKKTKEGYIKLDSWRRLYDQDSSDFNPNYMEHLEGYLEYNICDTVLRNPQNGKIFTYQDISKNDYCEYEVVPNWDCIIKDICNKCYTSKPIFYELPYHKFPVFFKNPMIFNTNDFQFEDIPYDKILLTQNTTACISSSNRDTQIIDEIMSVFIKDESIIDKFKKLCKSILLKPSNKTIIFYDGGMSGSYKLSSWLKDAFYVLGLQRGSDFIDADDYYSEKAQYNKLFKKHTPRCVFIHKYQSKYSAPCKILHKSNESIINNFTNLGIKNIIIQSDSLVKNYTSFTNMEKYIDQNLETLSLLITDEQKRKDFIKSHPRYFDTLLYSGNYFFLNMLAWCLS